jgi:hypothetical protein
VKRNFSVALVVALLLHALVYWALQTIGTALPALHVASTAAGQVAVTIVSAPEAPSAQPPIALQANPTTLALPALPVIPAQAGVHGAAPSTPPAQRLDSSAALQLPATVSLNYTSTKGSAQSRMVLSWRTQTVGGELTYELLYEGDNGTQQTSTGRINSLGLAPDRFTDKRSRKSQQAAHFDAAARTVTFSNNRPSALWTVGAQDRLSVLVQLAGIVQGQSRALVAGQTIDVPVATTDELELWRFEVQPTDPEMPNAVKLLRRPRRAFDAQIELWLSESVQFMPVRMRQTDSSGVTDQRLN